MAPSLRKGAKLCFLVEDPACSKLATGREMDLCELSRRMFPEAFLVRDMLSLVPTEPEQEQEPPSGRAVGLRFYLGCSVCAVALDT